MTEAEARAAYQRMTPAERSFISSLPPHEAHFFVEFFIHFPGVRILDLKPEPTEHPSEQATLDL